MTIREPKTEDLNQLAQLFDDYRIFYKQPSDLIRANNFLSERLSNSDSKIYVCDSGNNQLIGFVQLYPLFSSTRMKKLWLLNDLFVTPNFRGKGVSIKLIDKAKELVKDTSACAMCLETEKSNRIGNQLYPRTGFELNKGSNFYEWTPH